MNFPDNWPTEEMIAAGFRVLRADYPHEKSFRIALFLTMLEASPKGDFLPLCEDEGCPHHGVDHICLKSQLTPIEHLLNAIQAMEGQKIEYRLALQLNNIYNALQLSLLNKEEEK